MDKSRTTGFGLAAALALTAASAFAGQITVYERPGFQGHNMTTSSAVPNIETSAFNDIAMSVVVNDGVWEACSQAYFRGRCAQLVPGNYSRLADALDGRIASVRQIAYEPATTRIIVGPDNPAVTVNPLAAPIVVAPAQVVTPAQVVVTSPTVVAAVPVPAGPRAILYQHTGSSISAVELTTNVDDLSNREFGNSADAALVSGGVWRLCDGKFGRGQCTDFQPGQYASLGGLDGKVKSAYLVAPVADRGGTVAVVPPGRAVLYQYPNFGGPPAVIEYGRAPDLDWAHFRTPAQSMRIESGAWLVCAELGYQGQCQVLGPGEYPTVTGLGQGIASARQVWRPEYGEVDLYRRH